MIKRSKLLLFLVLPLVPICLFYGCDQPEDVLTPITKTNIWLTPSKLPSNPDGMVYELWVANSTDSIPIEKFGYDFGMGRFLEPDGSLRADTNRFFLPYDLLDFTILFVSVERDPDDNTNSPGPIMLMDITAYETIKLKFPKSDSLWAATIWYNMETPSDGLDSITDGYALWFATYTERTRALNDTTGINDFWVDSVLLTDRQPPDTVISSIGIDLASIIIKDTSRIYGLDTVTHTVCRFDIILDTMVDTPYYATTLGIEYAVTFGTVVCDTFSQGPDNEDFGMPVLIDYGWKYKGWVVSPQIDSIAVTTRMTKPAWVIQNEALEETEGAMLTIGTFADVRLPDDANPHVVSARVPPFPGEDFLVNLPGGIGPVNLVPSLGGNPGRVFLSLEPVNAVSDTTNFPLIPFIGPFPDRRDEVTADVQQFFLRGWMQDESDPFCGFPWMMVEYERF